VVLLPADLSRCRLLQRRSQKEGAMAERNLTEREDRVVGIFLVALAIIVVFIFINSG
jgi:hypothetical protein